MQVPVGHFDLMAVRRPLADISNVKSENLRFKMMETEKKIAESMFSEAFKEKEVIRLQSIKTVELLKIELKKSEEALAAALNKMASQSDEFGADSILNQQKIDDLMEEILDLRTQLAVATATIAQQKAKLDENETLRASIADATATIARQRSKLEINKLLRASIANATATIAHQQAQIEENELLRTSIAEATATILEQKSKLEENETLRASIADATATIAQQQAQIEENDTLRASIADATTTISEQGAKIQENELLRTSIAEATVAVAQQQLSLIENEMLRATIAHATATIAQQKAKLEENDTLRTSIADATATIALQQAQIEENELLRASIAEATATILEQKARLAENELLTVSIEEDVVELQSKSSLLASALTIAYDTISKQEKEIEVSTQEKVLHSEELGSLLDENAQLKNKVEVLASAADEHEPIVASIHREKEEFATRVVYLEQQLIEMTELHELEKAESIPVPDELQISMNIISEISEDLHLENVQEVAALNACVATLQWQNSKLIVENQDLSDSRKSIQENFSHRIKLLKQKLGWKTRVLTLANALQRTHDIDLAEVTSTMEFDIQMLTEKLMDVRKTLGEKVNELTVLRVDDNRKNNELQALIEQLEESHDHSLISRAEISTLQRERSLLEAECSARTTAMTILEEECNARNTTISLLEEECSSRNNTICGLEEECSIMSESKCATEKEIDEVTGRFVRMNEDIMTKLEEQAEEHSFSESRLENLLWNTKEEHLTYMKLVKDLNNKILEKEFETTRLLKNETMLNDRLNTESALNTVLENKKARLSEDKKELKAQLVENEAEYTLRKKEIMDEYIVVCDTLTKRNNQNTALENEITEKNREIAELKDTVFQLEVQLISGGELVATLESQVCTPARTSHLFNLFFVIK
jgi:hypothetical protein